MRLAVYQCRSLPADVERNLARIATVAHRAANDGVDILLFPEMMVTGYNIGPEAIGRLAEPADGPWAERIAAVARREAIAIAYGYPERAADRVYNAAQLIGRDGTVHLKYRKTHLFGDVERRAFAPGEGEFPLTDIDGWRAGLLICYDVEFPETVRLLALSGADLVLVPTALMTPYDAVASVLIPARALENQVYVAYANYCGSEAGLDYCGSSLIASPDGAIPARAGADEALLVADIEQGLLADSRRLNTYLRDRRPALYRRLSENPSGSRS